MSELESRDSVYHYEVGGADLSLNTGWALHSSQGQDWCSRELAPVISDLISQIRADGGCLKPSKIRQIKARDAFTAAAKEPGWPFVLPREIVFPTNLYPIEFYFHHVTKRFGISVNAPAQLCELSLALSGEEGNLPPMRSAMAIALKKQNALGTDPDRIEFSQRAIELPGIYRLQHAMLAFRSQQACIVTDFVLCGSAADIIHPRGLPQETLIAITHSHGDHFSLASLMQLPKCTKIVVPRVPRNSMLCTNIYDLLLEAGFKNVYALEPGETIQHCDQMITALPFYGEQPWVTFESPDADLRNWGLTYLIKSNDTVSWVLADSGYEFGKSMLDVAYQISRMHVKLDYVFSNLRKFHWHPGQIDSSGRYLACFTRQQLAMPQKWPFGQPITLGPEGVGQLLNLIDAKAFYPYAHWWHDLDSSALLIDGHQPEHEMVEQAAQAAGRLCPTDFRNWSIGSRIE